MKRVQSNVGLIAAFSMFVPAVVHGAGAAAAPKGVLAELVKADATSMTIVQIGQVTSVTTAVSPQTMITGICHDCQQAMTFAAVVASKQCSVCPCKVSATACIAQQPLKPGTWTQLVTAMPAGTGLEVIYNDAGKPESGVKSFTINEMRVLVSVDGPGRLNAASLRRALKPVGATAAEFAADNKQVVLTVAEAWSSANATKLAQILAANGIKVAAPAAG